MKGYLQDSQGEFVPRLEEDRNKGLRYYISADLAVSEKDRADYTCFVVDGMDEDGLVLQIYQHHKV